MTTVDTRWYSTTVVCALTVDDRNGSINVEIIV